MKFKNGINKGIHKTTVPNRNLEIRKNCIGQRLKGG